MKPIARFMCFLALAACGGEQTAGPSVVNVSDTKGTPLVVGSGSATPAPPTEIARDEDGPVPIRADDPRIGPANASVTVVVFVDLQCPHCAVAHANLSALAARTSVRVVFKHYPLASHPAAAPAAEAAQGVYVLAGGKAFSAFAAKVLASQNPTRADFEKWAKEVGVKPDAFARGLDQGAWQETVKADRAAGDALKIEGVPTIYIAGTRYQGDGSVDGLEAAVKAAK